MKGAIQDFYNLLTAPQTVSNMYTQVARAQLCANHLHVGRRDSSAIKFDRV